MHLSLLIEGTFCSILQKVYRFNFPDALQVARIFVSFWHEHVVMQTQL